MVCSCVNEEKYIQEIKQMSHREIVFPNGYIELRCNSSLKLDSLLKQITGCSCTQYTYAIYRHCYDGGHDDLCTSLHVHEYI